MKIAFFGNKEFIRKLTEITLANLENEAFGGKELSREAGMSIPLLNKRLQFIVHKTTNQFIREVRLQQAMELLQHEAVTAAEVAFKVGFGSPAYFNSCFSEFFGITPGEVKRRGKIGTDVFENDCFSEPEVINFNEKKVKSISKQGKTHWWKTIIYSLIVIFVISLSFYYFNDKYFNNSKTPGDKRLKNHLKSIAVLPFINDSNDPDNEYFTNGVMEAILNNLSKINDLDVRPRTSVEQYRNNKTKNLRQIGQELGVDYIVEGSGQKIDNQIMLTIQLIEVDSEKHLLSKPYNRKLEDVFNLQSEVAFDLALEIMAKITHEERILIEKSPTGSVAAWEMYSRGMELHNIALLENNKDFDRRAEVFFKRAIQLDSTYADAYVQLAWSVVRENEDYKFYLAERALHFDDKNPSAHGLKGAELLRRGMEKEAEEAWKLSLKYDPNYSSAYRWLGNLYYQQEDYFKAIKYMLKALPQENNSIQERNNLLKLWRSFNDLGFYEEGQRYAERLIEITGDSTYYYLTLISEDINLGKYEMVAKYAQQIYNIDSLNLGRFYGECYFLGNIYLNLRDYKNAYKVLTKYTESIKQQGRKIEPYFPFGFIYQQNGQKEEADFHFEGSIKKALIMNEQNKPSQSCEMHLGLVYVYAARGEKAKALEHLRIINNCDSMHYNCLQIPGFKLSPMFDCIRQEPEFTKFLKNAEARFLEDHNRIEKQLREEGIIDNSVK